MTEPFELPKFPTAYTEKDQEILGELKGERKELEKAYKQRLTPKAWEEVPEWQKMPIEAIHDLTSAEESNWPFSLFKNVLPTSMITPEHARERLIEIEHEIYEIERRQIVANRLPVIQAEILYQKLIGNQVDDPTFLQSLEADLSKDFTDEERRWIEVFAQSIAMSTTDSLLMGGGLFGTGEPIQLTPEDIEAWYAQNAPSVSSEYIMSTVAFTNNLREIQQTLQAAYPPNVSEEMTVDEGLMNSLEAYYRQIAEELGIVPEGMSLEELQASINQTISNEGQKVFLEDLEAGVGGKAVILPDNTVWAENDIGREKIATYDPETGAFNPLPEEEQVAAIDQIPFEIITEDGQVLNMTWKLSDSSVWLEGEKIGSIDEEGNFDQGWLAEMYQDSPEAAQRIMDGLFVGLDWLNKELFQPAGEAVRDIWSNITGFFDSDEEKDANSWAKKQLSELQDAINATIMGKSTEWGDRFEPTDSGVIFGGARLDFVPAEGTEARERYDARIAEIEAERIRRGGVPETEYESLSWWEQLLWELPIFAGFGAAGITATRARAALKPFTVGGRAMARAAGAVPAGTQITAPVATAVRTALAPLAGQEWLFGKVIEYGLITPIRLTATSAPAYINTAWMKHAASKVFPKASKEYIQFFHIWRKANIGDIPGAVSSMAEGMRTNPKFKKGLLNWIRTHQWTEPEAQTFAKMIGTTAGAATEASDSTSMVIANVVRQATDQKIPVSQLTTATINKATPVGVELEKTAGLVSQLETLGYSAKVIGDMEAAEAWAILLQGKEFVMQTKVAEVNPQIKIIEDTITGITQEQYAFEHSLKVMAQRLQRQLDEKAPRDELRETIEAVKNLKARVDESKAERAKYEKYLEVLKTKNEPVIEEATPAQELSGITIYHGTEVEGLTYDKLSMDNVGQHFGLATDDIEGIYFSTKRSLADFYKSIEAGKGHVIEASIDPKAEVIKWEEVDERSTEELIADGVDVVLRYGSDGEYSEVIVVNSDVIKAPVKAPKSSVVKARENWDSASEATRSSLASEAGLTEEVVGKGWSDLSKLQKGKLRDIAAEGGTGGEAPLPTETAGSPPGGAIPPKPPTGENFGTPIPYGSGPFDYIAIDSLGRVPSLADIVHREQDVIHLHPEVSRFLRMSSKGERVKGQYMSKGKELWDSITDAELRGEMAKDADIRKPKHKAEMEWDDLSWDDKRKFALYAIPDNSVTPKPDFPVPMAKWAFPGELGIEFFNIDKELQFYEEAFGGLLPFFKEYMHIARPVSKGIIEKVDENFTKLFFKNSNLAGVVQNQDSLQRVADYFEAEYKGSTLPELSENEEILHEVLKNFFKAWEAPARILKFINHYSPDVEKMLKSFPDVKEAGIEDELQTAIDLYQRYNQVHASWDGADPEERPLAKAILDESWLEFANYMRDRSWGLIKNGFAPRMVVQPELLNEIIPLLVSAQRGRGRIEMRNKIDTPRRMENIIKRADLYNRQMSSMWYLRDVWTDLDNLMDAAWDKLRNPHLLERILVNYKKAVEGYPGEEYNIIFSGFARLRKTAATAVFNTMPYLPVRNLFQGMAYHFDRSEYFKAQAGYKAFPASWQHKYDLYYAKLMSEMRGLRKDWLYGANRFLWDAPDLPPDIPAGTKKMVERMWGFPTKGLSKVANLLDDIGIYSISDDVIRRASGRAYLNKAYKALKKYKSDKDLGKWLKDSGALNLRTIERKELILYLLDPNPIDMVVPGLREVTGEEAASFMLADMEDAYTHFFYTRHERASIEMGQFGRLAFELQTFPRQYMQRMYVQFESLAEAWRKMQDGTPLKEVFRESQKAWKNIVFIVLFGAITSSILAELTGRRWRAPYTPFEALSPDLGGFAIGITEDMLELMGATVTAISPDATDEEKSMAMTKLINLITSGADTLIPVYKILIDSLSAAEGFPEGRVDRQFLKELRAKIDENYTPEQLEQMEMTFFEKVQRGLFGGQPVEVDTFLDQRMLMEELELGLGKLGADGRLYTLKDFGNAIASARSNVGTDLIFTDSHGWSDLVLYYMAYARAYDQLQRVSTVGSAREKFRQQLGPEFDAWLLFWGKYSRPTQASIAENLEVFDIITSLFDEFGVMQVPTMHSHFAEWSRMDRKEWLEWIKETYTES